MTLKHGGIARGLDALFSEFKNDSDQKLLDHISYLSIEQLQPGKYQPRRNITNEQIKNLSDSIKNEGLIQPILVRKNNQDGYEIIAGERRWRASKLAGLKNIPVIIKHVTDDTALALALIENIQREDLNPIDEALALSRLKDEFSMTHDEIAKRVGRSRSAITNIMRLLALNSKVKFLLQEGKLEMGHGRALLSLNNEQQLVAAHQIVELGLSVRAAESLVKKIQQPKLCESDTPAFFKDSQSWGRILSQKLSTAVQVQLNKKGEGRVIIQVNSPDEVKWLIDHINCDV